MKLSQALIVFCGGGLGSLARFGLSRLFSAQAERLSWPPLGTMAANAMGCLCIGFLASLASHSLISSHARLFLIVGFLGGLTTFSSYSLEAVLLAQAGRQLHALAYCLGSALLGFSLAALGMFLGGLPGRH